MAKFPVGDDHFNQNDFFRRLIAGSGTISLALYLLRRHSMNSSDAIKILWKRMI